MLFTHVDRTARLSLSGSNQAFLIDDGWDDFHLKTMFELVVFDAKGRRYKAGNVKILYRGLESGRVEIPSSFDELGTDYCSLGQDENYYETIAALPGALGDRVLRGLCDCVRDSTVFDSFRDEPGFRTSLLRFVSEDALKSAFPGALQGQARLTPFRFVYTLSPRRDAVDVPLTFDVNPTSMPPTNVHVVIGRNGVGKTRLLGNIASVLCGAQRETATVGDGRLEFIKLKENETVGERFTNLIAVTFSAFDPFLTPDSSDETRRNVRYTYVGLKTLPNSIDGRPAVPRAARNKQTEELSSEFGESLANCLSGPRQLRWIRCIETLETDPGFQELDIPSTVLREDALNAITGIFANASAGHKIVMLILTRLVELAEDKTLVLIDEPEAHLHPPLLSSFVRALSYLLTLRNSVAIVSTHSPVVLQEVPRACVWMLRRSGESVSAERPEIETFGENVGVLTREVFGLEVTKSGFHSLIAKQVERSPKNYEGVLDAFGKHLGAEAKGIARALTQLEE